MDCAGCLQCVLFLGGSCAVVFGACYFVGGFNYRAGSVFRLLSVCRVQVCFSSCRVGFASG